MEERFVTDALDIVVVVLIGVGGAVMLMGNIVILCNRGYTPIKAKSVPLTFLSSVGGLIWIMAALVVNDHFPRKQGKWNAICPLWTYWLQACFGFALWLNCLTLRLITLYRIFICKRDSRGIYYLLILLLAPAIVFCIAGSAITNTIQFDPAKKDCVFKKKAWAYGLVVLLVLYFLIFLGFAFKLRKTVSPLNEYRLIRRGGVLSLFLFLLSLVTLATHAYEKSVGRCLLSAAVASTIFYYFWARNGVVVYNVLFHKEKYLNKFTAELRRSPSNHERDECSDATLKIENQLREIRGQVEKYRDHIKQLEDELKALELSYDDAMQQKNSSKSSPDFHESFTWTRREPC